MTSREAYRRLGPHLRIERIGLRKAQAAQWMHERGLAGRREFLWIDDAPTFGTVFGGYFAALVWSGGGRPPTYGEFCTWYVLPMEGFDG